MFHVKHEALQASAERCGVELSANQAVLLERYEELLRSRAMPAGMVASGDAARLRQRHILDCLRAVSLVPARAERLCDLGSGAGLPGLVLAVGLPAMEVTLAESRRARVAFLEFTIEELGLPNVKVHHGRAQELDERFDVCTARAFARLGRSWAVAAPLLTPGGCLLYWAGRGAAPTREAPPGTRVEPAFPSSALARSGPVVIMTRQ
jgi:16S rRNA (guanine527-N7)-methyltransferase